MKLYATITSERASKGQGGKELKISVMNEAQEEIYRLRVDMDIKGRARMALYYDEETARLPLIGSLSRERKTEKGEKEKGEPYKGSVREADDEAFDDANAGGR